MKILGAKKIKKLKHHDKAEVIKEKFQLNIIY